MGEIQRPRDGRWSELFRECSSRVEQLEIPLKASEFEKI